MYCPSCGKQNPDGSKFCESCGSNMMSQQNGGSSSQQQNGSSPPPQQTYTPPPQQQYSQPQQNYTPPTYSQPGQSSYGSQNLDAPLTMGNYIVMFLLSSVTCGIALLVWAFGSNVNTNKQNYARAALLMAVISIVLSILFSVLFAGVLGSLFSSGYNYNW